MSNTISIENSHNDSVTINPLGAKFTLTLAGQLILTSITRGDGKPGITHPCTPIFGPDRNNLYGLTQHGAMRSQEVSLTQEANQIVVNHLISDPGYPTGMQIEQILTIDNGIFSFSMTHTNTGDTPMPVNSGEHCYFDAPQGFQGTTINDQDVSEIIINNVNGATVDLLPTNIINILGKPTYQLTQTGFSKAMLWVGRHPQTGVIDSNYICIEPVEAEPTSDFFGSPASFIEPASQRKADFTLSVATIQNSN